MAVSNKPYEIVAFPYTAWLAPGGTAMPTLIESEKAEKESKPKITGWTRVGTSGALNYNESGVTVTHSQTLANFTGAGATMPRKAWRTDEALEVSFELADISAKQYAYILDNTAVSIVAGVTGTAEKTGEESFSLYKGPLVYNYALLLVGISPMNANYYAQYYMPACYQSANPAPKYTLKGGPAMLALQFVSIIEEVGRYPEWHGQIEP